MSDEASGGLQAEVEQLRADNQRLRDEVERLRAELHRVGRYLREPPPASGAAAATEGDVGWVYRRGDLDDDLGDD